ncbi:hypothetical protein [Streptomyces sp. NPDC127190]|uniref:hypothetical protein n=1 Tax=unclassified Streptomyces TaxID=2593676 RepID=UPI003625356B
MSPRDRPLAFPLHPLRQGREVPRERLLSHVRALRYYGTLVDPARAAKPKDKPRVERPMPYVRDSFWSGREFTSVEQMQAEALTWSTGTAGRR